MDNKFKWIGSYFFLLVSNSNLLHLQRCFNFFVVKQIKKLVNWLLDNKLILSLLRSHPQTLSPYTSLFIGSRSDYIRIDTQKSTVNFGWQSVNWPFHMVFYCPYLYLCTVCDDANLKEIKKYSLPTRDPVISGFRIDFT